MMPTRRAGGSPWPSRIAPPGARPRLGGSFIQERIHGSIVVAEGPSAAVRDAQRRTSLLDQSG